MKGKQDITLDSLWLMIVSSLQNEFDIPAITQKSMGQGYWNSVRTEILQTVEQFLQLDNVVEEGESIELDEDQMVNAIALGGLELREKLTAFVQAVTGIVVDNATLESLAESAASLPPIIFEKPVSIGQESPFISPSSRNPSPNPSPYPSPYPSTVPNPNPSPNPLLYPTFQASDFDIPVPDLHSEQDDPDLRLAIAMSLGQGTHKEAVIPNQNLTDLERVQEFELQLAIKRSLGLETPNAPLPNHVLSLTQVMFEEENLLQYLKTKDSGIDWTKYTHQDWKLMAKLTIEFAKGEVGEVPVISINEDDLRRMEDAFKALIELKALGVEPEEVFDLFANVLFPEGVDDVYIEERDPAFLKFAYGEIVSLVNSLGPDNAKAIALEGGYLTTIEENYKESQSQKPSWESKLTSGKRGFASPSPCNTLDSEQAAKRLKRDTPEHSEEEKNTKTRDEVMGKWNRSPSPESGKRR